MDENLGTKMFKLVTLGFMLYMIIVTGVNLTLTNEIQQNDIFHKECIEKILVNLNISHQYHEIILKNPEKYLF